MHNAFDMTNKQSERQVIWIMEENSIVESSAGQEKDILNILMESNLYLELTLNERYMLLKHIVEYYRSTVLSLYVCPANSWTGWAAPHSFLSSFFVFQQIL